jgi:hypothetical protein
VFLIMFNTGQAEPLVRTRIPRPRSSRGQYAEQPCRKLALGPGHQPVPELDSAENRTQTRIIRVREQSTSGFSPCQQARPQAVRIREHTTASTVRQQALAMGANRPQTVRSLALSTSTISPLTNIGRKPRQARHCPSRRIVVSMSPLTSFPVHISNIPAHVLI